MIRVGIIGIGKMGLSHLAVINTHPDVQVVGLCDSTGYVLDVMNKYTGLPVFNDYRTLLAEAKPDAVLVTTPSRTHAEICRAALESGRHVFVEKPFCLSVVEGQDLVDLATTSGKVNQVGYHYRFVGAFREVKRLLDLGVIGVVHNFRVQAYGPVVLQPKGSTWRSNKKEGGGCLYDYASHAANLVTYLFGLPVGVGGTVVHSVFSRDVDDEVYSTLHYRNGLSGQMCINWSDETHRKMSMRMEIWGTNGKIIADRQECQVYLRDARPDAELPVGWSIRYTTELTEPVRYYMRGEEYSSQIDYFVEGIRVGRQDNISSFASALETDQVLDMLERDASLGPRTLVAGVGQAPIRRLTGIRGALVRLLGGSDTVRIS
ncbi:MAG: Gfo/Idh/MocA family protein [Porticoccaceae bacterium]